MEPKESQQSGEADACEAVTSSSLCVSTQRHLTAKELCDVLHIAPYQFRTLCANHSFPRPVSSSNPPLYPSDAVRAYVQDRPELFRRWSIAEEPKPNGCITLVSEEKEGQEPMHLRGCIRSMLSRILNVSEKTLARWRSRGILEGVPLYFIGKRIQVFVPEEEINHAHKEHAEQLQRGSDFRQSDEQERLLMIKHARKLMAEDNMSPAAVIKRVAQDMQRNEGTVRFAIVKHDQANPQESVFPGNLPLTQKMKQQVSLQHQQGASVSELAQQYQRSNKEIKHAIREMRLFVIQHLPLDYIFNEQFEQAYASEKREAKILSSMPLAAKPAERKRASSGLPAYLARLYEVPLLTPEQELHLFRKMNYLKYKASRLRASVDAEHPNFKTMNRIDALHDSAMQVKNKILEANLRLVVSWAKRSSKNNNEFFEHVSDGHMALMRAIDKFDFALGNKFSTYASVTLLRHSQREGIKKYQQEQRFIPVGTQAFNMVQEGRSNPQEQDVVRVKQQLMVESLLHALKDDRQRMIIQAHFGLPPYGHPLTLEEVGAILGITKERVRQIEVNALKRMSRNARVNKCELPETSSEENGLPRFNGFLRTREE